MVKCPLISSSSLVLVIFTMSNTSTEDFKPRTCLSSITILSMLPIVAGKVIAQAEPVNGGSLCTYFDTEMVVVPNILFTAACTSLAVAVTARISDLNEFK